MSSYLDYEATYYDLYSGEGRQVLARALTSSISADGRLSLWDAVDNVFDDCKYEDGELHVRKFTFRYPKGTMLPVKPEERYKFERETPPTEIVFLTNWENVVVEEETAAGAEESD